MIPSYFTQLHDKGEVNAGGVGYSFGLVGSLSY